MRKAIYVLIIAGLQALTALGQTTGITNYAVSIPTTTVHPINVEKSSTFVIDNHNNKWIGFNFGNASSFQLIRFNGTQWDTFPAYTALSPTNKVNTLAVDAANNVWIGSNMGLTKYDGTNFTTYNTGNSTLSSDTIISLACGGGNVYAGSYKGLSVYNGTSFSNYNSASNGMKSDTVYCITAESPTAIWLGNKYGMDKFNGSSFAFSYVAAGNVADVVNCIYIDSLNNKWIGTNGHGAIKYDNTNFYTMQQLFPNVSTEQDLIGAGYWPTTVKSICKGFHAGVLFGMGEYVAPVGSGQQNSFGSGIEIKGNQLFPYNNTTFSPGPYSLTSSYFVMQHDLDSNVVFFIVYNIYNPGNVCLYSFNPNHFVPYPEDMSTTNTAFLDINNVNALITDNSNQHWDNLTGQTKYFVPKQNNISPLFTSAMWIGGYASGNLHVAAMTYRQEGVDFWPGPIDPASGSVSTLIMNAYNQVWKVNRFDIANFQYNWSAGLIQSGAIVPQTSILNWPGNSPYGGHLAPYVDVNHNGVYDPIAGGDYPLIKGDQMVWSVYNDIYNHHGETGGLPLGIEVRASAYAYTCPNIADSDVVLNNTTFYNYQIINQSTNQYDSTRMSLWMDTDLGNYADDYIGCDVMNNFGFTYNGDNYDDDTQFLPGYHANLPVFACNVLNGPLANPNDGIDNNNNGIIDEPNEHCLMDGFIYYNNTTDPLNGNPAGGGSGGASLQYYNFMNNQWKNGIAMTYSASGTLYAGTPCRFLYPGVSDPYGIGMGGSIANPVAPPGGTAAYGVTGWTEGQAGNSPTDMRFQVNIGPFTMKPDSIYSFDYALVFSQDSANCYGNALCPITRAIQDNQRIRNWFTNNAFPSCLSLNGLGIQQNNVVQSLDLKLYPNPASSMVYVEFGTPQKQITIELYDMLGNLISGFQYNQLDKYATIPVSLLQSGVYMVKVQTQEGSSVKKFVKE